MTTLVEQVKDSKLEFGLDSVIKGNSRRIQIIEKHLNNDVSVLKWLSNKSQPFIATLKKQNEDITLYIYCFVVTYLGRPHPTYKKRIQISTSSNLSYLDKEVNEKQCTLLLGLYTYDCNNPLIVAWEPEKNRNPGKSKSCHVFTSDLLLGSINGIYQRKDSRKNTVFVFKPQYLSNFIDFYRRKILFNEEVFTLPTQELRVNHINLIFEKLKEDLIFNKGVWNGESCVLEMRNSGDRNWSQSEWQGFYFEHYSKKYFGNILEMPGPKFGNTKFDAFVNIPWDFKVHSINKNEGGEILANDLEAINDAINEYGSVGFIVLEGYPVFEKNREFTDWHTQLKGGPSKYQIKGLQIERKHRKRKKEFLPSKLLGIILRNKDLDKHGIFQENMKNSSGKNRKAKLKIILSKLDESNLVFHSDF